MKLQPTLARLLAFAGVPLCLGLIMLLFAQSKSNRNDQHMNNSNKPGTPGQLVMLDPHGDAELAGLVPPPTSAPSTTVQIILSRNVSGYELPCLGFTGFGDLESRVAETFGLVIFGGELYPDWPGMHSYAVPASHIFRIYDFRYGAATADGTGVEWSALRAAFGSPGWPEDSPMYISPDGQPSLAELEPGFKASAQHHAIRNQEIHATQKADGWTVTVVQARAQGDSISFDYTVTGPHSRYTIDRPVLSIGGNNLEPDPARLENEVLGPAVGTVSAPRSLVEEPHPRTIAIRFEIPAIHIRPAKYPCEGPGAPPTENLPTPTAIQGQFAITPEPDVKTVGPFAFDLNVVVQPRPTEPPVPSPIPTPLGMEIPSPRPTGNP